MTQGARAAVYEALAAGLCRPTPETVQAWAGYAVPRALSRVSLLAISGREPAWGDLGVFSAAVAGQGPDLVASEMLVEYGRLFLGPERVPCPPYGSLYLDGVIMGPSTLDVLQRYRAAGLKVSPSWREPPDHIALELAFMAALAARYHHAALSSAQPEALTLLRAQHDFLSRHLGHWGPQFAEKLAENASLPFYRFLASFLSSWLPTDAELVRAAIGAPEVSEPCA